MWKTKEGYNIRTYDGVILHFILGEKYKAIGTVSDTKDKEVIGKLIYNKFFENL